MNHARVLLLGGSGFIGRHVAAGLAARGRGVLVPTRNPMAARLLSPLPTVIVEEADIHDDGQLQRLVGRVESVINLVGVLHGKRGDPWGPEFEQAHVRLPARVAKACLAAGVGRLLHVSALGVTEGGEANAPSMYLRSKAAGERAIRESGLSGWTILRPSVVFGSNDRFLNLFARLQRWLPVLALGRAEARFQPVYVGDVAQAIVTALEEPRTVDRCYELAGPEVFTLRELIGIAGELSGKRRPVIGLSDGVGRLQAGLLERLPGRLMSRDNFDSMSIDNVATGPVAPELGLEPTSIASVAPHWTSERNARIGLARMRAGR